MRPAKKIALIVAVAFVAIGLVLASFALYSIGDLKGAFHTESYETKVYTPEGSFTDIVIEADCDRVCFVPGEGSCRIECQENEKLTHTVSVKNGTLTVREQDLRNWYQHIGFFFGGERTLTVYLPQSAYESLSVKSNTGDVEIPADFSFQEAALVTDTADISFYASVKNGLSVTTDTGDMKLAGIGPESLALESDTGKITLNGVQTAADIRIAVHTGDLSLKDVSCSGFAAKSTTGDMQLENVTASDEMRIETDTGDVDLIACDAGSLDIKTNTGDVSGTLRTEKIFFAESDTGKISVPKTLTGGKCEIRTDTGDIRIEIGE